MEQMDNYRQGNHFVMSNVPPLNAFEAGFLALLSSQRDMLGYLHQAEINDMRRDSFGPHHAQFINSSIAERQPGTDLLQSKRLSLLGGLGGTSDHMPHTISFEGAPKDAADTLYSKSPLRQFSPFQKKKRRLSSLGFLSPSFFEEHAHHAKPAVAGVGVGRRGSMASIATFASMALVNPAVTGAGGGRRGSMASIATFASMHDARHNLPLKSMPIEVDSIDDDSVISEVETGDVMDTFNVAMPPRAPAMSSSYHNNNMVKNDDKTKETMEAFADAMTQSTKSQQAIHDWDRQMGLKRSHSKTMRLSMRSRKKLKTIMKKEINALTGKK